MDETPPLERPAIPDLKPGLRLVCVKPDGTWLRYGREYVIRDVFPALDGRDVLIGVGPRAGPREMLWWPGRFRLAESI